MPSAFAIEDDCIENKGMHAKDERSNGASVEEFISGGAENDIYAERAGLESLVKFFKKI